MEGIEAFLINNKNPNLKDKKEQKN